jgi:hypothetical protein
MSCKPAENEFWKFIYWAVPWLIACIAAWISGSNPRPIHRDLCWTKRSWNMFFSEEVGFPLKEKIHQYVHKHSPIYHQNNVILATDRIVIKRVIFSASEVSPHRYQKEHLIWGLNNFNTFAKLRKATIIFVMSVCPSVRMEQLVPLDGFS